ncbi:unnamed protein product [Nesidiocoris tenuis]|uniref:Cadherin domain-containing protein n=1 Tax=Nesidiocoris tenuis TaxID=355587 RepID=A0A6H5FXE4_9HEMI|nr:unnamed protein product [Nesidiocoris tenuis]CAB0015484.1 unnamed protein product [Nesidiocoris tenuis]
MDVHYFRITATSDDGPIPARTATTTLQINVGDVNDHPPVFESSTNSAGGSTAALSESAPVGSVVAQLRATDMDIGINAQVYTIVARASDLAQPLDSRLTSTVSLVVRVMDENDNYPQFGERTVSVNLPEETPSLSNPVITHIKATDADAGQNGALRFAIIGGNTQGQFAIDSQSGEVTLVKPLDYEAIRSYRLVIRAQGTSIGLKFRA